MPARWWWLLNESGEGIQSIPTLQLQHPSYLVTVFGSVEVKTSTSGNPLLVL